MLYRKSPPSPPRMLLRIVAASGAAAVASACSGAMEPTPMLNGTLATLTDSGSSGSGDGGLIPNSGNFEAGSVPFVEPDGSQFVAVGSVAVMGSSSGAPGDDAGDPFCCGIMSSSGGSFTYPPDSGDDAVSSYDAAPHDAAPTDAAHHVAVDSGLPCGIGFCGTIVMPRDAGGDAVGGGILLGLVVRPSGDGGA